MRTPAVALALLLGACVSAPLPNDVYYRLQAGAAAQRFETPRVDGMIVVERPRAPAVYATRDIAWSDDPQALQLSHYHYHHWADPPAQLLQQALVDYLRSANFASSIALEAGRLAPVYRISGGIRRFERVRSDAGWAVAVMLDLRADPAAGERPVLLKQYESSVAAKDDSIEATVQAFSDATGAVFGRFLADLAEAVRNPEPAAH